MPAALELEPLVAQPVAQASQVGARIVEQAAVVVQGREQRIGQLLGRRQIPRDPGQSRESLDPRADEGGDVARGQHEAAHRDQRDAVEDGALTRGDQQGTTLVDKLAHRQRPGVRAQLDQLRRQAKAPAGFLGVGRGAQFEDRVAARLRGGMHRHQGEHLVELKRSQVSFAH